MKIQPFGEKVAIKLIKEKEVPLGALITVVSNEDPNKGEVIALGDAVTDYIHIGDVIVFNKNAGVSYTDGNDDYKILNVRDILGKVIQ